MSECVFVCVCVRQGVGQLRATSAQGPLALFVYMRVCVFMCVAMFLCLARVGVRLCVRVLIRPLLTLCLHTLQWPMRTPHTIFRLGEPLI